MSARRRHPMARRLDGRPRQRARPLPVGGCTTHVGVAKASLVVATVGDMEARWTPEPFEADDGTVPFERFIEDLSDFKFVALDTAISHVLAVRGIDLARTEWLKALGDC